MGLARERGYCRHPSGRRPSPSGCPLCAVRAGRLIAQVVATSFADIEELTAILDALVATRESVAVALFDDGTWEFSMIVNAVEDLAGPLQSDGDGDGEGEERAADLLAALDLAEAEVVIRVSLPWEPIEHIGRRAAAAV